MRILALVPLLSVIGHVTYSQEPTELDRRNGFKDIQMAVPVDSVRGAEYKKDVKNHDGTILKLYDVDGPEYQSIGDIVVESVEILAYRNMVYEISVVTEKDPRLMKGLSTALGPPAFNARDQIYIWSGSNLSLTFSSHSRNKLELRYHSNKVTQLIKRDKEKKIEEIADDF